ncbi:MAG: acyl-CoA/acyl-ACP dehydrogenase [Actinobacteria bacterium]|nr:acyl-CoA/acyl-ACP dehydrogenase [Actinomycetota bacterium]
MGLTEGREDLHADLRDGVRRVCSKFDDAYWRDCDENHEFPWAFYETLAEGGWIGIAIPEQFGGGGQGITEASILLEEIAASGAAMNGCSAIHLSIFGMNPVVKHGSDAMREKYLPKVVDGSLHVAFGVTEPDAGTDTTSITTSARKVDGGYLVRGRKVWTTKALYAQKVLLLVRTTPQEQCAKRTDGMTLLLADLQRPEVDIRPIPKAGRNAVVSCEVRYDDLFVEEADRVGEEGRGFHYLLDGLNPERILVAGESIGIGRAAIAKAVSYAKDRVVFGRPIGQNQGIQHPLAECWAYLESAFWMGMRAAALYDSKQPCGAEANATKFLGGRAAFEACTQAVLTHGGMGYAKEYHVERLFRECMFARIAPVTEQLILSFIGEHVLDLPKSY